MLAAGKGTQVARKKLRCGNEVMSLGLDVNGRRLMEIG